MQPAVNAPLAVPTVARSVWSDLRRARGPLVVFEAIFKLLEAWLIVPAVALVLSAILSRSGQLAVSNRDILDFLISPPGLLYATLFSTVGVALLLFEQAGLMILVGPADRPPLRQVVLAAFRKALHVTTLGAVKVVLLAITLVPFALLAALTYQVFLSRHDINFYLEARPPVFWFAAGIGVLLLLAALGTGVWLYVRWVFALPIILFENQSAPAALRASHKRVRGASWRIGVLLIGWQVGVLLIGLGLELGFRFAAATILKNAGERPIVVILLLLTAQGGLLAFLSFVRVVGLALMTRRLYLVRTEHVGILIPDRSAVENPSPARVRAFALLSIGSALFAPLALWTDLSRQASNRPLVRVTAHRGHSLAAPENTLSAVRKAIESGADYVEIDVQRTADGTVVLLHDRDLKRVAGVSRSLRELTLDEVQKLDVGSFFSPSFAGEQVPTLADVIQLSRGRAKLNIELKYYGPDPQLAGEVERIVREQDFESDSLVTSFNSDALSDLRRRNPRIRTGLTIAHALGDVSRLDGEVLSVRADWLSDDVLRSAHRAGKEVHVWTVNDDRQMTRLMKRGVDNIITDDPDLLVRVRAGWTSLTPGERLLLASRLLLGLDP